MADVPGQLIDLSSTVSNDLFDLPLATADFPGLDPTDLPQFRTTTWQMYTMVGTDAVLTTRGTWDVLGSPDPTAAQYAGALATPLRDVHILSIRSV